METVNIFAPELRGKVRKEVDFLPDAWVEFYDDITMAVVEKAQSAEGTQAGLELLVNQIANWNFADEQGQLELSLASLKRLPLKLLNWMTKVQTELLQNPEAEAKKKEDQQAVDSGTHDQEQQAELPA